MAYNYDTVILAAGLSSRMGAFKPLLPFGKSTIIETVVD
ncbi:MAG: NTP transferase domain-containing protein, partial [Candidatus Neomarinimicrobiota bacterium]